MTEMPEGYPLPPIDSQGSKIKEGDTVRIDVVPDSLVRGLDAEEKATVLSCVGKEMEVTEIDEYGYAWVQIDLLRTEDEHISHSFSNEPRYLTKVR